MSDNPDGKKYIGMAFNKDKETPSDKASDYKWVKYVADYEGLEIGGRNLLQESTSSNLIPSSGGKLTNFGDSWSYWAKVEPNKTYTISRSNDNNNRFRIVYLDKEPVSGIEYLSLMNRDSYLEDTFTTPSDVTHVLIYLQYVEPVSGDKPNVQLEKGIVATDWSPAPEDIFARIDNVDKAHVGLSNVQNYGIALESQAKAGVSNATYMTPLRTKQALEALGGGEVIMCENENVTYEKYPSGLLICRCNNSVGMTGETGAYFRSDAQTWEFPHEFISDDISVTFTTRVANRWGGTTGAINTDRVPYRIYGTKNTGEFMVILTAIGRWK